MCSFRALYGRSPPPLLRIGHNTTPMDSLEHELRSGDAILDDHKLHLLRAQYRMKKWADGKRKDRSFAVGDLVFLKLQPYRQQSFAKRPCDKLAARFNGPYEVIEKIGEVAYKLLPPESKIHPVFHVSQLKAAKGASFDPTPLPAQLAPSLELMVEPEMVLGVRQHDNQGQESAEVLIQWKGLPSSEAT